MFRRFIFVIAVLLLSSGPLALVVPAAATFDTKKDPGSVEDFTIDWATGSGGVPGPATNNPITASTWTVPTGMTHVTDSFTPTKALIRLSGGVAPTTYRVTNRVTLTDGQVLVVSVNIHVETF